MKIFLCITNVNPLFHPTNISWLKNEVIRFGIDLVSTEAFTKLKKYEMKEAQAKSPWGIIKVP
jgi:hypothetical protein